MSLCRWRVGVDVVCSLRSAVRTDPFVQIGMLRVFGCLVGGQGSQSRPTPVVLQCIGGIRSDAHRFTYDVTVKLFSYAWYDDV